MLEERSCHRACTVLFVRDITIKPFIVFSEDMGNTAVIIEC